MSPSCACKPRCSLVEEECTLTPLISSVDMQLLPTVVVSCVVWESVCRSGLTVMADVETVSGSGCCFDSV